MDFICNVILNHWPALFIALGVVGAFGSLATRDDISSLLASCFFIGLGFFFYEFPVGALWQWLTENTVLALTGLLLLNAVVGFLRSAHWNFSEATVVFFFFGGAAVFIYALFETDVQMWIDNDRVYYTLLLAGIFLFAGPLFVGLRIGFYASVFLSVCAAGFYYLGPVESWPWMNQTEVSTVIYHPFWRDALVFPIWMWEEKMSVVLTLLLAGFYLRLGGLGAALFVTLIAFLFLYYPPADLWNLANQYRLVSFIIEGSYCSVFLKSLLIISITVAFWQGARKLLVHKKPPLWRVQLTVVSAGSGTRVWHDRLERELAQKGYLAKEKDQADAVVVVIDKTFPVAILAGDELDATCFHTIRRALATGAKLLPVTIGKATVPPSSKLPDEIDSIANYQSFELHEQSQLPGVVAHLVTAVGKSGQTASPGKNQKERVFISYRRNDSRYWAALLAWALIQRIGIRCVFFDIGSLVPGQRFEKVIQTKIEDATDFVILIGPSFFSAGRDGKPRIESPDDFVHREIRSALELGKPIHTVLVGNAVMPKPAQLPPDIAPAFAKLGMLGRLANRRDAEGLAGVILSKPVFKPNFLRSSYSTSEEKAERLINVAAPVLFSLGWSVVKSAIGKGKVVMIRPDASQLRFSLDFENEELVLEESCSRLKTLGLRQWVPRATFFFGADAPVNDMLRLPDRYIEAMYDPLAYLKRAGRFDLDNMPQPPMSLQDAYRFARDSNQSGASAVALWSKEVSRIYATGGLWELNKLKSISLKQNVEVVTLHAHLDPNWIYAATNKGVFTIDLTSGEVVSTMIRKKTLSLGLSASGMLASVDHKYRLYILDKDGSLIVRRQIPYSFWQRVQGYRTLASELSWCESENCIAICASDRLWVYKLDSDKFILLERRREYNTIKKPALFLPHAEELLTNSSNSIQLVLAASGKMVRDYSLKKLVDESETKTESALYAGNSIETKCMGLAPNGTVLALGGKDSQLVLFDVPSHKPRGIFVWHAPFLNEGTSGEVVGLAFSHDSRWLASIANDKRIVLGNVQTAESAYEGSADIPIFSRSSICWSQDDKRIAVASGFNTIEVWETGVTTPKKDSESALAS